MDTTIVTDGLRFPEGPVWMLDGSVIVVEIEAGRLTRVMPDGAKQVSPSPAAGRTGRRSGPTAGSMSATMAASAGWSRTGS